jgi:CARDB
MLNHIYFVGPLAPGQSYSHTGTFSIPQGIAAGNWYAVPVVDTHFFAGGPLGAIGSGNIGRDQNSTLVLVAPPVPSDLEVTSVSAPTNAALGANITVAWSVTNNGINLTSANIWYDSVYLSPATPFNASQSVGLGSFAHLGALDIGQGYSVSYNMTVPANYLPTNSPSTANYLYVYTDSGDVVSELTKTNNVLGALQPIVIRQAPPVVPADLAVISVTIASLVVAGTTATVSWAVTNQGAGTTSVSTWVDSVYLTHTPTLNRAVDIHLADIPHNGVLAPGGSYVANQVLSLPYCAIGFYYVVVVTDSGQQVNEGGALANNTLSSPNQLWIYPSMAARIEVSAVNPPASVQAGSPLAVSWTVQNLANSTANTPWFDAVYLSPVPQFLPGSSYLLGVYPHVGGLGSSGSYAAAQSPVVPRCLSGTYYVAVITDVSNSVDNISCDTNNVLTASSSTLIFPSSYPSLQVTGLSLPPGANAGSP